MNIDKNIDDCRRAVEIINTNRQKAKAILKKSNEVTGPIVIEMFEYYDMAIDNLSALINSMIPLLQSYQALYERKKEEIDTTLNVKSDSIRMN